MKNSLFILSFFMLISCSTQRISLDYDRNQDFSELRDFRIEFLGDSMNEIEQNRIKSALQTELATKNMQFNENSAVVLTVASEEYISQKQNSQVGIGMNSGNRGFGTSFGFGIPITSQKLNQNYFISLYNSANQLVWTGEMKIEVPAKANPEVIENNIQKGIRKLFKNYPPTR